LASQPGGVQDFAGTQRAVCGIVAPAALLNATVGLGVCMGTPHTLLLYPRILVISGQDTYDLLLGTPFDHLVASVGIDTLQRAFKLRPRFWSEGDPFPVVALPLRNTCLSESSRWQRTPLSVNHLLTHPDRTSLSFSTLAYLGHHLPVPASPTRSSNSLGEASS
jgi:hypothetical protein